jgi:hypothetical protein
MRTRTTIDKKQRKHEMLLTFLANAQKEKKAPKKQDKISVRHAILLLLGTV